MTAWSEIQDQASEMMPWPLVHFFFGSLIAFYLPEKKETSKAWTVPCGVFTFTPSSRLTPITFGSIELRLPQPSILRPQLFIFFTIIYGFETLEYVFGAVIELSGGDSYWIETTPANSLVSDILMAGFGWGFTALLINNDNMTVQSWEGVAHALLVSIGTLYIHIGDLGVNDAFIYFMVWTVVVNILAVAYYRGCRAKNNKDNKQSIDKRNNSIALFTILHTILFVLVGIFKWINGTWSAPTITFFAFFLTTVFVGACDCGLRSWMTKDTAPPGPAYSPAPKTTGFII